MGDIRRNEVDRNRRKNITKTSVIFIILVPRMYFTFNPLEGALSDKK